MSAGPFRGRSSDQRNVPDDVGYPEPHPTPGGFPGEGAYLEPDDGPASRRTRGPSARIRSAAEALVPAALRGSRLDPGRRGVVVIAVIALLAAVIAGIGAWRARPDPEPVAVPAPEQGSTSPSTGPLLVVAVAGKVRRPGVVRLPPGSRVADAVAAAGGAVPGTDLAMLNLARKVVDGEQIVVGAPAPAGGPQPAGAPPQPGALLNLNAATAAQLDTLPGVGPVLAQRLVEYRTANGGFRSVDQLREVEGIGESRFQRLKELVTV